MPARRHIRLPCLALLALWIAVTDASAQITTPSPATDYGNPEAWLCRPGRPGERAGDFRGDHDLDAPQARIES